MTNGVRLQTNHDLLHELWEYVQDGMNLHLFCLAGPAGDGARANLPAHAKLTWTVRAGSHFEAMTLFHERQGWERYITDQPWDLQPYPEAWVAEQKAFLAG